MENISSKVKMKQINLSKFILGVLLLILIGIGIPYFTSVTIIPSKKYWLSSEKLRNLEERVYSNQDSDAAYTISMYYEVVKKDYRTMLYWLEKSAKLGNESAKKKWRGLEGLRKALNEENEAAGDADGNK